MLSVFLNIFTILLVLFTFYITYRVYDQKKDTGITPLQVYKSLVDDLTAESVTQALTLPKVGDVGTFVGYDYPISKKSGVGGGLRLHNPIPVDELGSEDYAGTLSETRFT